MAEKKKSQIQKIRDGDLGPGNAPKGQPYGPGPVTDSKDIIELTTLPSTARTGHGENDRGER
jgi:hypothetical protein